MLLHGSCAVYREAGLLIRGPSGSGKSDLLLRLLGQGFELVADDYVLFENGYARAPEHLRGLIAIRGLGVYKRQYRASARLRFVVEPSDQRAWITPHQLCTDTNLPIIMTDFASSACVNVIQLIAGCFSGEVREVAGPLFGPANDADA